MARTVYKCITSMTFIRHNIQTKCGASHDSLCSPVCVGIHDLSDRQYFFIVCFKKGRATTLHYTQTLHRLLALHRRSRYDRPRRFFSFSFFIAHESDPKTQLKSNSSVETRLPQACCFYRYGH